MEILRVFFGTFVLRTILGAATGKDPLLDFVVFTTKAVAGRTNYILIGASIVPNLAKNFSIGVALSPSMNGTHYDKTPQYRTETTKRTISDDFFPDGTVVSYVDDEIEDYYYISLQLEIPANREVPEGVGVFHLGAVLDGFRPAIANLPMHNENAIVQPIQRGITASVGDSILTLTVDTGETSLRWTKDGGKEIQKWNDQSSVTINDVRLADAGLYECYVAGSRSEGRHAFIVVHVRKCPASKWSPPLCQSTCPLCYNGGICDVYLGICLCRPGFTGDNCETSYGGNHFGFSGTVKCTTKSIECSQKIYCGQDPIGCGCASGWNGLACDVECESGMYGNDCTMNCHCADTDCDHSEGCAVNAECDKGFEGERCLTPVHSECDAGFYGVFCNLECHCENSEPCNKDNASCPGNCKEGWAGSFCLVALPALYDAPFVEFRQNTVLVTWTAWNQSHDFGSAEASSYVLKYWKQSSPDDVITIDNITDLQIEIHISSIEYNQTYSTSVSINTTVEGTIVRGRPSPSMDFGPIDPPSLLSLPKLESRSSVGINVTWTEWSYVLDEGMGEVIGYLIEWWDAVEAIDVRNATFIGEPSEGILIPDIPYNTSVIVRIKTIYVEANRESVGEASPVLVVQKEQLCPYDWELFDKKCYLFGDSFVNWDDASSFCQQQNAILVSITSQDENDYVTSTAREKSNNHIWIGLNFGFLEWHWTSNERFSFYNWQEPMDITAGTCGKLDTSSDGLWVNIRCKTSNQNTAVCEKDVQTFGCIDGNWHGYQDSCYRRFNNLTSRQESKKACRALRKADLVSIHSTEEDSFVQTIIQHVEGDSWIGLKKFSGDLIWSDGTTAIDYVKNIDTKNSNATCVVYTKKNHILSLEFRICEEKNAYVCKDIRDSSLDAVCYRMKLPKMLEN